MQAGKPRRYIYQAAKMRKLVMYNILFKNLNQTIFDH